MSGSKTARAVAIHRARHVLLDDARFFGGFLQQRVLGMSDEDLIGGSKRSGRSLRSPKSRKVRYFLCIRSLLAMRLAQEAIVERNVSQVVLLGAGFDCSLVEGNNWTENVALFEVDEAETQTVKRSRLEQLQIPHDRLKFVPVDLEHCGDLIKELAKHGFDPESKNTFFVWLGVVPYLTKNAIEKTLSQMRNAEVIFDFGEPPELHPPSKQFERRAREVANEEWKTFFEPKQLCEWMGKLGFSNMKLYG